MEASFIGSKFKQRKISQSQALGASDQKKLNIKEFFQGKHILLTGATGFTGKVLLHKLLKSCSNVGRIYILLRTKRNTQKVQQLNYLTNSRCFEDLKMEMGEVAFNQLIQDKIIPISGDLIHEGLGLEFADRELIT